MSDGNDKRFAQFPMGNAAWSSEKEKELLSLRKQNKSLQESMVTLLEAKLEKENENSKLLTKVEQLERDFLKKAKEVDSLKDEQVTTEEKLDKLPRTTKRDKRTLDDCRAEILQLRKEREKLYQRTHYDAAYISQMHVDFKKLEEQLKEHKSELEKSHNKTMKDLVHNQKEAIIVTLKEDVKRLQAELDDRDKQIAD